MWFAGRHVRWLVCLAALPLPCELTSGSGIRRGGNRVCSSGNQPLMMRPTHWGSALLCSTAWMFCFPLRSPFVLRLWLHSALCFRKKLYPIDPLLHCCIQDTVVSSCCIQSWISQDDSRICPHSQQFRSLVRFTPYLFITACSFNHLSHTFLSHSVAREMRRCGRRWEFLVNFGRTNILCTWV